MIKNEKKRTIPPGLNEKLALLGLIDQGMRVGTSESMVMEDLFSNLWELVNATVSGSKIDLLKPEDSKNGFRVFEANAETGENLGHLNMLYLKKPIPCYYLIYVEVAAPFRRKGLGNLILKYFREFLIDKSAVGILDNIIPEDDPTYDIYARRDWEPIERIIGDDISYASGNYMVYIPPGLKNDRLRQSLIKLLYHLKRKRAAMDMRDNEIMVQRTIAEFKSLYASLVTYFQTEFNRGEISPLMRFFFTRFVTKFIAFRRRISELLGYTGGESLEQIRLSSEIEAMRVKSYAPFELAAPSSYVMGREDLWQRLPETLKRRPARIIESLPNYHRPNLDAWLDTHGILPDRPLTLGDLMDLGFDPTRLKEFSLDGMDYIFERIQTRQIPGLGKKKELLDKAGELLADLKVDNAWIRINPPLLVIRDNVSAYVLRSKVNGIHREEAMEQLQVHEPLKAMNMHMKIDKLIESSVTKTRELITDRMNVDAEAIKDVVTFFIPWDLKANRPKLMIEFDGTYFESIWLA